MVDFSALRLDTTEHDPSRIVVKFRDGADASALAVLPGTTLGDEIAPDLMPELRTIHITGSATVAEVLQAYASNPLIEYVTPNYNVSIAVMPNDPDFQSGLLWGMHNTGQSGGVADADIDGPEAWDKGTGGYGTGANPNIVAVIDTGVDYRHQDLYLNIWINQNEIPAVRKALLTDTDSDGQITFFDLNDPVNQGVGKITDLNGNGRIDGGDLLVAFNVDGTGGWANGLNDDNDTGPFPDDLVGGRFLNNQSPWTNNNPLDDNGHGTHVSGTIAGIGNNATGVVGVSWRTQIMALKFLGSGGGGTFEDSVRAVNYSVAKGAKISSNSWGGGSHFQPLKDAIAAAGAAGQLFIAAAGNHGTSAPLYPAAFFYPNNTFNISVAATTRTDARASFSAYGLGNPGGNPPTGPVHLGAPGLDIRSTWLNGTYNTISGTSMATPHVSGTAALLRSKAPNATAAQLMAAILESVDPNAALANPGPTPVLTGGRLNAAKALDKIVPAAGPVVTSHTPNGTVPAPVDKMQVTFDRAINVSTFTTADIVSFNGPGGSIPVTGVAPVGGSGNTKFDISFAPQSAPGAYSMTLGPDIEDTSGNKMDQDFDGTPGEVPDDRFTGGFSIQPPPPSAVIIDNGQTGYAEVGDWYTWDGVGYNNNERYTDPGTSNKASWQLTGVPSGTFQVWATWMWGNTNATYQVFDGPTLRGTFTFNQSNEPSGPVFGGRPFQPLGTSFPTNSGTVRVELLAAPPSGGWVLADAVRFVVPTPSGPVVSIAATDPDASEPGSNTGTFTVSRTGSTGSALTVNYAISGTATNGGDYQMLTGTVQIPAGQVSAPIVVTPIDDPNPEPTETVIVTITSGSYTIGDPSQATVNIADNDAPPPPPAFIIDNIDSGYSETGSPWYDFAAGYNNNERFTDPGSPNKAIWQASGLAPGSYTVQATWMWGNADQAPYSIFDGATLRGTVVVNQIPEPVGPVFGGRPFQTLGSFTINGGTIRVELGTDANDWALADAIRVVAGGGGGGAGGLGGFLDRGSDPAGLPGSPEALSGDTAPWLPMDPGTDLPDVPLVPLGVDETIPSAPLPILDEGAVDWVFGHPDLIETPLAPEEENGWEDPLADPVGNLPL